MTGSTAGRALRRVGQTVEVINYTKTGEDAYGENYSPNLPAEAVSARVDPGDPDHLQDEVGNDAVLDAAIFVEDSVTISRTGGGDGATRIDVDQDGVGEYVVVFANDQGNGLTRLDCRRRTDL